MFCIKENNSYHKFIVDTKLEPNWDQYRPKAQQIWRKVWGGDEFRCCEDCLQLLQILIFFMNTSFVVKRRIINLNNVQNIATNILKKLINSKPINSDTNHRPIENNKSVNHLNLFCQSSVISEQLCSRVKTWRHEDMKTWLMFSPNAKY